MKNDKYKEAGVDPDQAGQLIRGLMKEAQPVGPLPAGYFCQLIALPDWMAVHGSYLAIGTDGVGTKLMLGAQTGLLRGLGQDLVGMVYNDLITSGGQPFAFLDYFATGRLDPSVYGTVIQSIRSACDACNMPLIGGETAEMPGLYAAGDFDLAGFGVAGVLHKDVLDPARTVPGDVLVGFPSSGFHSNGYSLIRKVIAEQSLDLEEQKTFGGGDCRSVKEWLMEPTRLYVDVMEAIRAHDIEVISLAHITGGGYGENLPRALADTCAAVVHREAFDVPGCALFHWFAELADLSFDEMLATFNGGYGLTAIVRASAVDAIIEQFPDANVLGEVVPRKDRAVSFV